MASANQNPETSSEDGMKKKFDTENTLPINLQMTGRIEEAIATYKRAIKRRTRDHGKTSLEVARSLSDLGELYLDEGRFGEAEEELWNALMIRAAHVTLPEDDEDDEAFKVRRDASISHDLLGRLYEKRGDIATARRIRTTGLEELGQAICGNPLVTTSPQLRNLRLHTHEVARACY